MAILLTYINKWPLLTNDWLNNWSLTSKVSGEINNCLRPAKNQAQKCGWKNKLSENRKKLFKMKKASRKSSCESLNQFRHEPSHHRLGMGGKTSPSPPISKYLSEIFSPSHIKLTNKTRIWTLNRSSDRRNSRILN